MFTVEVLEYKGERNVNENGLIAKEGDDKEIAVVFGNCKFFDLWARCD